MNTAPVSHATTKFFILLLAIFSHTLEAHTISTALLFPFSPATLTPSSSPLVDQIGNTPSLTSPTASLLLTPSLKANLPPSSSASPTHDPKPKHNNLSDILDSIINHADASAHPHSHPHPHPHQNSNHHHNATAPAGVHLGNCTHPHPPYPLQNCTAPENVTGTTGQLHDRGMARIKVSNEPVNIPAKLSAASRERLELRRKLLVREQGWRFALVVFIVGGLGLL